ncbi:MAG: hypothetical protein LAQ30_10080, partial [Acidobacteriia bacterium]|nr:hypothetical protein [Terriglobia bacterium]
STFGLLLLLCGSRILLPGAAAAGVWPALAVGCVWAGGFFGRLTLQVHGVVYLFLATVSTGALARAAAVLLGADATVNAEWAVWTGAATALVCCVLAARGDSRPARISCLAVAGILVWLAAGIAASGLVAGYHAVMGPAASHAYCATLRTTVLAGASLLLAWAGARWNNLEFSRLIYPVMALGAYRLLMEDMHQERKAALFLSLLVYGAALTVLPRISRKSV